MRRFLRFAAAVLAAVIPLQLAHAEHSWRMSEDGRARVWTDDPRGFSWSGGCVDGFADGVGSLHIYDGGRKVETRRCFLVFGAREGDFSELNGSGDMYAGEGRGKGTSLVPEGTGVLVKSGGSTYAGEFRRGRVEGRAVRRLGGEVVYKGGFKAGLYSGFGEMYEGGRMVFAGMFKKGRRDGDGTEYHGGLSMSGRFRGGVKDGTFTVLGNGITRRVEYRDGKPCLEKARVSYPGGVEWTGPVDSTLDPAGEGVVRYPSGDVYTGEVEGNRRSGFGTFVSGGVSYSGNWEDDECSGFGEAVFSDGWTYSGSWSGGAFDGFGVLRAGDIRYSGDWAVGKRSGYGTLSMGGLSYSGQFSGDRLNGHGLMEYPNGDVYEGSWVDSRREGYGEYHWADGTSYFGEWTDDLQDGEGAMSFPGGESYSGGFMDGHFHGPGSYTFASGDRYEGWFENDEKEGLGTYFFADGNSYEGEFRGGRMDGTGKFYFGDGGEKDGCFYDGEFRDGRMKGRGSLFIPVEGGFAIVTSRFWDGTDFPTRASVVFPNGDEFVGLLEDGRPTSEGKWRRASDRTVSDSAYDFYKEHEGTIKSVASTAQLVLAGISVAGDVVAVVAAVPCPPAAAVALAVSKIADIASASISGLGILVGTGAMTREVSDAEAMGDYEEAERIRGEYFKEQAWNLADVVLTFGSSAFKAARAGSDAAKAADVYPGIRRAVKDSGLISDAARRSKVGAGLVRGAVEAAYGKTARRLVSEYGDEAAELLFKYGDNAVSALTKGGDMTVRVASVGGGKALRAVFSAGEGALETLAGNAAHIDETAEIIARHGRRGLEVVPLFDGKAGAFFSSYAKRGDEIFSLADRLGRSDRKIFAELLSEYGDGLFSALGKVEGKPRELGRAVRYIASNGRAGLETVGRLGGAPASASLRSLGRQRILDAGRLRERVSAIRAKGGVRLSEKEMDWIRSDPKVNLRAMVRAKTGEKSFGKGFQEFFIRLSDGDAERVSELMAIPEVKKTVNHAIRGGGGVHEWLMTKNYADFLTNPKWGGDGAEISLALTELVQDTRSVAFKGGGTHFDKLNSGRFHDGLSRTIESSSSLDELLLNVRDYAEKSLTGESFEEFMEIFGRCFGRIR